MQWGTEYIFFYFYLLYLRNQLLTTGEGGRRIWEDHVIFRGKGGGNSSRRQSLKEGTIEIDCQF